MKKLFNAAVLIVLLLTYIGCSKDDGPNGNADIVNYTYTIQSNQWSTRGFYGEPGYQYYYEIGIPGITQNIINSGAVVVYIKRNDLNMFYPLPVITNNDGYVSTIQNNVYLGMVEIFIEDTDFLTEIPGPMTLKIVIFDQISSLPKSLDLRNFEQVEAYINK